MERPKFLRDQCLACGRDVYWKPAPELNMTVQYCDHCQQVVRSLERGIEPYTGGWLSDEDGNRYFQMPPYPGVDYLA